MMHATFDNVLIHCFQIFFTLTSGDLRWSANFTPELERQNCTVHYNVDELGKENVTVEVQNGKKTIEKPWQQYLRDHVDENLHAMMKRNVLLATRNFQHRVETFRKEVIFGQNNPMKVRHISYRVEFQGRGAAHIHGVLWLDLDELKVEGVNKYELKESYSKLKHSQPLESNEVRALEKFTDTFVTCTRCVSVAGAEAVKIAEETNWHGHSNSCRKGGARLCRWKFPRYPLERTIFVDANRDEVEPKLDAKVREEILDRVMRVLVQEEGGKKVLSKRVKKIMLSNRYPNVKEIGEEKTSASKEDEESDDSLQMSISAECQNLQQSLREDPSSEDEHPNTPSPRHFLPDDSSSLQIPISAETSTLQQSFPEDPSSQDHHPRTPSPRHFLPDDLCSQDQHPRTPSPRHYYPEDVLPLRNVISAEQPTLQQPSKTPSPDHFSSLQTPLSAERPTSTSKKLTLNPNALHIYGTNAKVNARNDAKLKEIGGELFKIKAKNASRTVKKFHINSAGCIRNTPFQDELRIKVGCDIVLVHNINTLDGLTNGCRGVLVAVEKTGEAIKRLIIKFNNPEHGRLQREKNPCHRHPQATYIDPIHWQYFLGGATATVFQFPVRGAAAITAHKIQVSCFDN